MPYGTLAADQISTSVTGVSLGAGNATRFKNRLINSDMRIDQRNSGASVSTSTTGSQTYSLDRWGYIVSAATKFTIQQNAGSVTPPAGFTNYLGCTSTAATSVGSTDYYQINQIIEGLNVADLGWGTADAKTVTLSFWVRSSLTGTFGGALRNSGLNRSYPFTYTISSANTWTQVSITIAGDTSGTWLTTNGAGIQVIFSLGMGSTYSGTSGAWAGANYASATGATSVVGTNGATWYITGVQLEVGSSATGFEYVDYTTQVAMCQRYFSKSWSTNTAVGGTVDDGKITFFVGTATTNPLYVYQKFPVSMRTGPTITVYDLAGASGKIYKGGNGKTANPIYQSTEGTQIGTDDATSASAIYYYWTAAAEL